MFSVDKIRHLTRMGLVALIALMIILSFGSALAGGVLFSSTATVASTTLTETTVVTNSTTISFTVTINDIRTVATTVVVTDSGPDAVAIAGSASTKTLGTTATKVSFVSVTKPGVNITAILNGGQYNLPDLPNHDFYTVYVYFTTAAGGVGSGRCVAGAMAAFFVGPVPAFNFSC